MIDLVGFWFVVSVLTLCLVVPVLGLVGAVLVQAAKQAMPEDAASKFSDFLLRSVDTRAVLGKKYVSDDEVVSEETFRQRGGLKSSIWRNKIIEKRGEGEAYTLLLNKFRINATSYSLAYTLGAILWVIYGIWYAVSQPALAALVSEIALFCSPLMGYVAVLVGMYAGTVLVMKMLYKGSVFISKVSNHIDDKEKHNDSPSDSSD